MSQSGPEGAPIDRYVVLEYLAEGGMGAIYLGKRLGAGGFEKHVVLKQLLPEFTRQPEFIDLFLREARLSATLDHANIVHTIDLVTAGDDYFIVMEYLDGADLRTLLKRVKRRRRQFSPAAALYVGRELLSALAYAHNKIGPNRQPLRLIHRDISPSNILISGGGEVKLTDFGIAKASTNSVFYRVKGKVGYMSPEQARSEPLDARSDLYSLAVCLYEIITGERLFVTAGLTTSAEEMYSQPIPLVSRKVAGLPPDLDMLMLKALAVDPAGRFQTAGEFQEALLRCAHRHGLMMSAPELAEHLEEVCGDSSTWRDPEAALPPPGAFDNPGGEGTEQINMGQFREIAEELEFGMDAELARRAKSSITKLSQLQRLELTSMINMAMEGGNGPSLGAIPLVDLDDLAGSVKLEGEPRRTPSPLPESPPLVPEEIPPLSSEPFLVDSGPFPPQAIIHTPLPELESIPIVRPPGESEKKRGLGRPLLIVTLILIAGSRPLAAIGLTGPELGAPRYPSAPAGSPPGEK